MGFIGDGRSDVQLFSPVNLVVLFIISPIVAVVLTLVFTAIWRVFHFVKSKEIYLMKSTEVAKNIELIQGVEGAKGDVRSVDLLSSARSAAIYAAILTYSNVLYIGFVFLTFGAAYFLLAIAYPIIALTRYPIMWLVGILGFDNKIFYELSPLFAFPYPQLTFVGYMTTFAIWFTVIFIIVRLYRKISIVFIKKNNGL